jgi:hypothetical protein
MHLVQTCFVLYKDQHKYDQSWSAILSTTERDSFKKKKLIMTDNEGKKVGGVDVMKEKELKLQEIESSHRLTH